MVSKFPPYSDVDVLCCDINGCYGDFPARFNSCLEFPIHFHWYFGIEWISFDVRLNELYVAKLSICMLIDDVDG